MQAQISCLPGEGSNRRQVRVCVHVSVSVKIYGNIWLTPSLISLLRVLSKNGIIDL